MLSNEAGAPRPQGCIFLATSLDGFLARPDGGLDWLKSVETPGEDYGFAAFSASVDTLVLGRRTHDTMLGLGAWPHEGKRCVVLTHRPLAQRHGEEAYAGDLRALVERLFREGARRLYVDGGEVVRQFLAARLVDELTISVIPLLLGSGVPLFLDGGPEQPLTLVESRAFPTGLVQLRYRPG